MTDIRKGFSRKSIARVTIPAENSGFARRGKMTMRGFRLGAELRGGVDQVRWGRCVGGDDVDLGPVSPEGELHLA